MTNTSYKAILLLSLVLIPFFTLSPFDFTVNGSDLNWKVFALSAGGEQDWEIVTNTLLYLPFGLGMTGFFSRERNKPKVLVSILLIGFTLSYFFEFLQSYLPSRFPSWRDVASNTLGGTLGSLGVFVWEKRSVALFLFCYLLIAFVLSIPMQSATTLKNWNVSYPLIVGNEHTGNRPWKGMVSEFYIANRAATEQEVSKIFAHKNPLLSLSGSLVVHYKKDEANGYRDESGNSPPLIAKNNHSLNSESPELTWFETSGPASHLANRLARSSQSTLGATIATQASNQNGPARIISLSRDPNLRNFTLGQAGQDLVFRLRTPLTGENGSYPALRVPSVFSTSEVRHIVLTYDASNLRVYIDGLRSPHSLELTPGLLVYNFLSRTDLPRSRAAHLFYYGIFFLPIGVMLLLALKKAKLNSDLHVILLGGLILSLISLGLEGLLVFVSGRQAQAENILLGMLFSYFSFLAIYFLLNKSVLLTHRTRAAS